LQQTLEFFWVNTQQSEKQNFYYLKVDSLENDVNYNEYYDEIFEDFYDFQKLSVTLHGQGAGSDPHD